jgi:hypothetical protein
VRRGWRARFLVDEFVALLEAGHFDAGREADAALGVAPFPGV